MKLFGKKESCSIEEKKEPRRRRLVVEELEHNQRDQEWVKDNYEMRKGGAGKKEQRAFSFSTFSFPLPILQNFLKTRVKDRRRNRRRPVSVSSTLPEYSWTAS